MIEGCPTHPCIVSGDAFDRVHQNVVFGRQFSPTYTTVPAGPVPSSSSEEEEKACVTEEDDDDDGDDDNDGWDTKKNKNKNNNKHKLIFRNGNLK